jgi:hypothetical protein
MAGGQGYCRQRRYFYSVTQLEDGKSGAWYCCMATLGRQLDISLDTELGATWKSNAVSSEGQMHLFIIR